MDISCVLYMLALGFLIEFMKAESLPFRLGYTLYGVDIMNSFTFVSIKQCQELCQARKMCLSIKIDRLYGVCHLSSSDSTTPGVQVVRKARTVYGEKISWIKKMIDERCTQCSDIETCLVNNDVVTCQVLECVKPDPPDQHSKLFGNQKTIGAKILRKCNDLPDNTQTSVCEDSGDWTDQTLACLLPVNIEGKTYKIYAKQTNTYWHFDGGHQILKVVSSLWQPSDSFVKFTFEKQVDGSYKIKSLAMPLYMYDGFDVPGAKGIYLNGDDQTDDDHMRYVITMETQDYYRIKTKATNRYVRLDEDKKVSSIQNLKDDRSLFKLVEA